MKKLFLCGRSEAGKTSLTQAMKGEKLHYWKTQYINTWDITIDTPGEAAENKKLGYELGAVSFDADIIGLDEDLIHVHGVLHAAAEPPGGVDGEIGVEADDVHAELDGDVRNERADRTEADDAEGLARELRAGEGGFALFDEEGDLIALVLEALDPVDAAEHVARGHDHGADDELLNCLSVCAGTVENHDALIAAGVEREVVRAGAAAGDDEQAVAKGIVMQIGAAQENALRIGHVRADGAAALDKRRDAALGDVVHDLDAEVFIFHGVPPQILSDRR